MLMKIKKLHKNFKKKKKIPKFQNHLGVLTRATHTSSYNEIGAIVSKIVDKPTPYHDLS